MAVLPTSKRCTQCLQDIPLTAFSPNTNRSDGRQSACRKCRNAVKRARYKPHPRPAPDRLALYSERVAPAGDHECWEWCGSFNPNGYGQLSIRVGGKPTTHWAHRLAHELFVGPIPEGYEVDHTCSNIRCVNPAHLEAVTSDENTRRAAARRMAVRNVRRFVLGAPA